MPLALGSQPLLGPVVGLCSWTLVVEAWMYALRLPALSKYNIDTDPQKIKQEMAKIPPELEYPADNYNHLMEQPTQFYATAIALNLMGVDDKVTVGAAWTYVSLRILHSLIQGTSNHIMTRFQVFACSSLTLLGLTAKAGWVLYKEYI